MLIEMNVGDLPGVDSVKANHGDGVTTVSFDPAKVDAARIADEIRSAGYEAEIVS
jgi:copper chaperone CopZ